MPRRIVAAMAPLALALTIAVSACGSSSSSSSSGGSSSSSSGSINVGNGSFCDQTRSAISQIDGLSKTLVPSPGATPNVTGFKQLISSLTSAIDALDGNAPGEIASDFHTLRTAYDTANTQVQSATTIEQIGTAFSSVDTPAVKTATDNISNYLKNTCGINPSATP
jgi:hypothetical protein